MTREELMGRVQRFKSQVNAVAAVATDAVASECVELYPTLTGDGSLIKAGTRIQWKGGLKRAANDLWDTAQNTPDAAPALWEDIAYYKGYRIIPQTITAGLAFSAGEIGYWPKDGKFYQAINNGTTWTPEGYAAAWKAVEV